MPNSPSSSSSSTTSFGKSNYENKMNKDCPDEIHEMLCKLKDLVPNKDPRRKKLSKLEIIQSVIDYINDLQTALDTHKSPSQEIDIEMNQWIEWGKLRVLWASETRATYGTCRRREPSSIDQHVYRSTLLFRVNRWTFLFPDEHSLSLHGSPSSRLDEYEEIQFN